MYVTLSTRKNLTKERKLSDENLSESTQCKSLLFLRVRTCSIATEQCPKSILGENDRIDAGAV